MTRRFMYLLERVCCSAARLCSMHNEFPLLMKAVLLRMAETALSLKWNYASAEPIFHCKRRLIALLLKLRPRKLNSSSIKARKDVSSWRAEGHGRCLGGSAPSLVFC